MNENSASNEIIAPTTPTQPSPIHFATPAQLVYAPPSPLGLAAPPPDQRHNRKCRVCNHPDRDDIEAYFIQWGSPQAISSYYKLPDGSLRRHARAVGLYARRQQSLRSALENVLEKSTTAHVTGDTIIRAVRAYTCLTDDNHWVEPASSVIFSKALPAGSAACEIISAESAEPPKALIAPGEIRK